MPDKKKASRVKGLLDTLSAYDPENRSTHTEGGVTRDMTVKEEAAGRYLNEAVTEHVPKWDRPDFNHKLARDRMDGSSIEDQADVMYGMTGGSSGSGFKMSGMKFYDKTKR
jgi:ribosomal protein S6E (S10)